MSTQVGGSTVEKVEEGAVSLNDRAEPEKDGFHGLMKLLSLLLLTPQYAALILLMRYVRTRPGPMFVTSTTVVLAEAIKTVTCLAIIIVQEGGFRQAWRYLNEFLLRRPLDFAKVCVPSLLFVLQNNLVFVAISRLDAATFQVTYQLKLMTTAVFSVVLLGKRLSVQQWLALVLLFAGVSVVQVKSAMSSATSCPDSSTATACPSQGGGEDDSLHRIAGLAAVLVCCCLSGFANVYFELLLKGGHQSVWLRNVQLGLSGFALSALACLAHDVKGIYEQGFLYGYDSLVWTVVLMQSLGGLLIAAVIKYADNILKGFSTTGSILLSCLASIYIFNFQVDQLFLLGTSLVLMAIYFYTAHPHTEGHHDPAACTRR